MSVDFAIAVDDEALIAEMAGGCLVVEETEVVFIPK
jgi:hypothetical protein